MALEHELRSIDRAVVDAQFARMAEDEAYQEEARRIVREFVHSDWEALRQGGTRPRRGRPR